MSPARRRAGRPARSAGAAARVTGGDSVDPFRILIVRSFNKTAEPSGDAQDHALSRAHGAPRARRDVAPLHKYQIAGRDAARLLDRLVTRDVSTTQIGQVLYTPWCDAQGKTIDDGTISRLGERQYRLTAAEPNLRWLQQNAFGMEVEIAEVSDAVGALALQGPLSRAVLDAVAEQPVDGLKYFRVMQNRIAGVEVQISRTGYTGDLGYELWIPAQGAIAVWDALIGRGAD